MDEHGQVYFGPEDEIPEADTKRYTEAERLEALRAELRAIDDRRVERLRQAPAESLTPEDIAEMLKGEL